MQKICCVCKKTKHGDRWVSRLVSGKARELSHCYCPRCYRRAMKQIANHNRQLSNAA